MSLSGRRLADVRHAFFNKGNRRRPSNVKWVGEVRMGGVTGGSMMIDRNRQRLYEILLICISLSIAAPCLSDVKAEAKKLFFKGVELFDKGAYVEALALFEKSYQLQARPSVLLNIGGCQQAMGQNVAAVKTFQKVIASEGATPKQLETAREKKTKLEEVVGYLRIVGPPDGAVVTIDGETVGAMPLEEMVVLDEGDHTLDIRLEAHEPYSKIITITSGMPLTYRVILRPAKGSISVTCDEGNVFIDGVERGKCPVNLDVNPGTHELVVQAPNKKNDVQIIEVVSGETVSRKVVLENASQSDASEAVAQSSAEPKMPDTDEETASETGNRPPVFLISGITAAALGVVGLGVGIGFSVRSERNYQDVVGVIDDANQAYEDDDMAAYDDYLAQYQTAKKDWEKNQRPADQAGIIAGYVIGSTLTVAGAVLLGIHFKKKRDDKVAAVPGFGGVGIAF